MPEEINRLMTDAISEWLFVTEPSGVENLRREGVDPRRIHLVGNLMIDTLLAHVESARALGVPRRLGLEARGYAVLTLHRPSNVDEPERLARLFEVLEELHAELPVVFPMHPRTGAAIERLLGGRKPRLRVLDPLGYLDFLGLMADARLVLTDSGGIQEEAPGLGKPVLVLREVTERPEGVGAGTVRLVGTNVEKIVSETRRLLDEPLAYDAMAHAVNPYGDGKASGRIVQALLDNTL
jgi:UDP-N-acetylglucosamine 2-epimerase (non-hydrolysing)